MKWYLELKGNEKFHAKLVLIFLFIIIMLLVYVIFMVKEVEFFVDGKELYDILMREIHCPICHPKGFN